MKNQPVVFDLSLNLARQALYRFAGLSLLDPKEGAWQKLDALRDDRILVEAAAVFRDAVRARTATSDEVESTLRTVDPRFVLSRLPDSRQTLNRDYENSFGLLVSSNCPPHEMEYVNSKLTFQRSNLLADISGFYTAFGFAVSETHRERPDHIVLELEFMASVIALERQAAEMKSADAAWHRQVCRDAQLRFLQEHVGSWVPAFGKLLAQQNGNGFYAAAGEFVAAYVAAERQLFQLPPTPSRIRPSMEERPEMCEGCQLAG
jgi:TorA maturation chaperone TorD